MRSERDDKAAQRTGFGLDRTLTAVLFAAALVLGGLGPHQPILVGLLEALALPLLVRLPFAAADAARPSRAAGIAAALAMALVLLCAAQLIPLPSSTWQALPGREVLAEIRGALGQGSGWWPVSLSPDDTRRALLSFLPAIAVFFATLLIGTHDRGRLAWIAVAVAVASALLGLLQFATGNEALLPWTQGRMTRFPGVFANVNHQAAMLACALALLVALKRGAPALLGPAMFWSIVAVLIAGVVVAGSRAGIAMTAALLPWVLQAAGLIGRESGSTRPMLRLAGMAGVAILIGVALAGSYRWEVMSGRFETVAADNRFVFWQVTMEAVRGYLPVGSGLGTFGVLYPGVEPLASIQDYVVNHAHNDYLEWTLEAGVPGLVWLAAALAWLAMQGVRAWRRADADAPLARAGSAIVLLIALHSVVDYPLRTQALGCMFAFAAALMVPPLTRRR